MRQFSFLKFSTYTAIQLLLFVVQGPIETSLIRAAINQIMADLNYWVTFAAVKIDSPEFKIHITPLRADK